MAMIRFMVVTTVLHFQRSGLSSAKMNLRSIDFEVCGRVQGVFFRKYTQKQASELGLKGWCRNTSQGTVEGTLQGPSDKVTDMIGWLKTKGSPSSQIDKAEFKNDRTIQEYTFDSFQILKDH